MEEEMKKNQNEQVPDFKSKKESKFKSKVRDFVLKWDEKQKERGAAIKEVLDAETEKMNEKDRASEKNHKKSLVLNISIVLGIVLLIVFAVHFLV